MYMKDGVWQFRNPQTLLYDSSLGIARLVPELPASSTNAIPVPSNSQSDQCEDISVSRVVLLAVGPLEYRERFRQAGLRNGNAHRPDNQTTSKECLLSSTTG